MLQLNNFSNRVFDLLFDCIPAACFCFVHIEIALFAQHLITSYFEYSTKLQLHVKPDICCYMWGCITLISNTYNHGALSYYVNSYSRNFQEDWLLKNKKVCIFQAAGATWIRKLNIVYHQPHHKVRNKKNIEKLFKTSWGWAVPSSAQPQLAANGLGMLTQLLLEPERGWTAA